jgi:hypothetical protein
MHRASPDSQLGSDGPHGKAFCLLSLNSPDHFNVCPGGSEFHAFGLGIGETGLYSIPDHRSLELREDAHHLEEGSASRRGRVDCLLVEIEVHAGTMALAQEAHEVL